MSGTVGSSLPERSSLRRTTLRSAESQRAYACARRVLDSAPDLGWDLRSSGTDIYAALAVEMGEARVRLDTGELVLAEAPVTVPAR